MNTIRVPAAIVCALVAATSASQEHSPLATKLTVGTTLADGNSETMQANASVVIERNRETGISFRTGIAANYGKATARTTDESGAVTENTDTTVENVNVFAGAKKTIAPSVFGSVDVAILHDDIAEIDNRATIGPGLGIYLLRNESAFMSAEIGPSYVREKVSGVRNGYLALRVGEHIEYCFGKTAKVWQSAEYLPKADEFSDYLLNVEIGAEAALNGHLGLSMVLQSRLDSTPGAGLERNDLTLIGGLNLSL